MKSKKFITLIFFFVLSLNLISCKVNKTEEKPDESAAKPPATKTYRIAIAYFGPDPGADLTIKGLLEGMQELGYTEGQNLEIHKTHANGEISGIPQMMQSIDSQNFDLIIPMSTPVLTGACAAVKNTPIVFMYVYDPVAAGAGKSMTDHMPNVTGVGSFPPVEETIDTIQKLVPGIKRIGTLYNSSEGNSRKVVEVGREILKNRGIELEEVTVTGTNEVYQAAQAVASRNIEAMWVSGDNTALQAFDGIGKVAVDSRLPLVINDAEFVEKGAIAAVGIGWYRSGRAAAKYADRVLKGENPKDIPFVNVAERKIVLNFDVAKNIGLTLPQELVDQAKAQ